jgi:hypothetical protein
MSSHGPTETDEEFDARYVAYFNKKDLDGWELRKVGCLKTAFLINLSFSKNHQGTL